MRATIATVILAAVLASGCASLNEYDDSYLTDRGQTSSCGNAAGTTGCIDE